MAAKGNWTIVFEDKMIIKNNGAETGTGYVINDNAFWSQSKFNNIWAVQYGTSNSSDEVEYRDNTPHSTFAEANIGEISDFTTKWDAAHLAQLQADWDANNVVDANGVSTETEAQKVTRLGSRPTSYTSGS